MALSLLDYTIATSDVHILEEIRCFCKICGTSYVIRKSIIIGSSIDDG